jgi:transposase InsO family protein
MWLHGETYKKKYVFRQINTLIDYSKKIMGFAVDNNMRVDLVKNALKMARKNMIFKHKVVIHHSDRGIQYCCLNYSQLAENTSRMLRKIKIIYEKRVYYEKKCVPLQFKKVNEIC